MLMISWLVKALLVGAALFFLLSLVFRVMAAVVTP
jgi:hypothetical protein